MSSLIAFRPLRLLCDLAQPNQVREQRSGIYPVIQRSSPTVFQLGFAIDGTIFDDLAGVISSVTVQVRATSAAASNVLMEQSGIAASLNGALTDAQWKAKTAQHLSIPFTGAQCNIAAGDYWIAIWITPPGGDQLPVAFGRITVTENGTSSDGDPATAIPETYSTTEADARFTVKVPAAGGYRFKDIGGGDVVFQLKDATTGGFRTVWFDNGVLQVGPSEA